MNAALRTPGEVYSPAMLAHRWDCSERHVRNLVATGQLRAFRLGNKLLRIPGEAVEDFERCLTTESAGSATGIASSSTGAASGIVTRLEPLTRARLNAVRRPSTPS